MDAQNAAGPASPKPAAASLKRPGSDPDQPREASTTTNNNKSPKISRRPSLSKEPRLDPPAGQDDAAQDGNSDAETIVLPGKDGLHSPSKVRKIKNEDSEAQARDRADHSTQRRHLTNSKHDRDGDRKDHDRADKVDKPSGLASSNGFGDSKRKKLLDRPDKPRSKDGSSGLSSAPASPPPQPRRRPSKAQSESGSEHARGIPPMKPSMSEKPHLPNKLVPHKRKTLKAESDDEAENRKVRRQRISGSGLSASRYRDPKSGPKLHDDSHAAPRNRSASPPARPHRRSISTQLPPQSANGLDLKKKRIPAPLQSTEYHSDESSASGSPHPRSSKLRSLTTPATAESAMSPAKLAPHKKHLDAHGQTFLARACAKGEYDVAKTRLQERPEDINVADFAGNTPLQIAALNGYEDIVRLLIDAGCSLDCVNYDKDTPLLDAVDNGHLGVVRLLLAAGVNPRKPNAYGQEPLDRVTDETDNAAGISQALVEAKRRMGERRRTSEEHHPQDRTDSRSSHGPEGGRRSPGAAHGTRRTGTVRSEKTSNHLLYMPMDDRTLRAAAAKGDEETVTRILQVRESFDDPESMVAAARGGHEMVMNLLLALGGANPDPKPLDASNEYSTPMLAAIGQENIKVVRLLLDQSNFDPTGTFKGETYHEIARRRKGPNWIEEEEMLKKAYDEYRKTHKESSKTKSPPSRRDHDQRRGNESKESLVPKTHKRKASSPTREPKKVNSGKPPPITSPREKRRSNSFSVNRDDQTSPKRGPGRPKKNDRIPTIAVSDHEGSPAPSNPTIKAKRTDSEMAASSEGEMVKPRRKLVSGRELKGEMEKKQRRASFASNASSLKEPQSPSDSRRDEPLEKQQKSERYHDRTKALKRDESRDRLSVSGENAAKRHRASATPPRHGSADKDGGEAPLKRRRLDVDGKEKRQKLSSSPDDRPHKPASNREAQSSALPSSSKPGQKPSREDSERKSSTKTKKPESATDAGHKELPSKPKISDKSIHVKAEDPDIQMRDIDAPADEPQAHPAPDKERQEEKLRGTKQDAVNVAQETRKKAEERDRQRKDDEEREKAEKERRRKEEEKEEEAKRRAEEEKRRRDEEQQQKRKEEEERKAKEEEERRRQEEESRQRQQQEAEEAKKREEAEKKKREEEEERKQREQEEKRLREEEERKKRIEEEKRREEEEERRRLEEAERLRREQLEREAAEEARRKREEEERRQREELERRQREEMERRRAAREAERLAEQRRIQQQQERLRLDKLPPLLRWLDASPNPRLAEVARKLSPTQGVRYDCIRPGATGTADGREQWLLNTQVALLLGEKDLTLSRCKCYGNMCTGVG